MKKRAIAVVIIWALFLCFVWQFRTVSYADPFTASQIGSLTYAMMQSWGINFTAGSATASGMNDFMTNQVESYVNSKGGSIADVFVGQIAVDVAGKLVVGHQMYNSVVGFLDWLKEKYSLSAEDFSLMDGTYNGAIIPSQGQGKSEISGVGIEVVPSDPITPESDPQQQPVNGYLWLTVYNGGNLFTKLQASWRRYSFTGSYSVALENSRIVVYLDTQAWKGGFYAPISFAVATVQGSLPNSLYWNGESFVEPTVLNPDKEWTGTIGGYSVPDINLEDLLGDIDQAVADNNLVVDGEVIDVPIPPSPQPTVAPDIPLQDVPWEGLNDLIDNSTDSITESIGEAASDITGALEGTQEAVESLEETITESLDVPAASEITGRKFDLSTLFPFCIPFDIYRMLQAFDGTPEAPHVQLPFVIQSIGFSYTFDLDFSAFDSVASIMRTVEFIAFGIFLAFSTSKVIRW